MKKLILTLSLAAVTAGAAPMSVHAENPAAVYVSPNVSLTPDSSYSQWIVIDNNMNTETQENLKNLLENCQIHVGFLLQNGCTDDSFGDIVIPDISVPETPAPEESLPTPPATEDTTPDAALPDTGTTAPSTPEEQPPAAAPDDVTEPSEDVHPYVLRIAELVNEERAKAGLNPVTLDTVASEAARVRAVEIVSSFSHTRPDGSSFATALKEQGVSYRTSGENIAWGQHSPEQVMEGWMNSSGHRANILKDSFTHIGVGYYQENGVNYWTQLFFG